MSTQPSDKADPADPADPADTPPPDAAAGPPGRLVRVAGLATHVLAVPGPAGVRPVVFSSGLGGAWYDWDPVLPLLAGLAPLVCFDRPGLGWSEPSPVPPSLEGEAERIRALLTTPRVAGPDAPPLGPAVLVGFSLAGFHLEAFARLYPDLVAGMVLVDASAEPDPPPPPSAGQSARRVARWRLLGDIGARTGLSGLSTPALRALAIRATRAGGSDLADRAEVAATGASGRLLTAAALENATYSELAARLLELRCELPFPQDPPLRVIAALGAGPLLSGVPFAAGRLSRRREAWLGRQRALAGLSANSRLIELTDSAHYVPYDRPDAVAEAVREALAAGV